MNFKAKLSDDAHTSYSSQVASYNDGQRLFYERQLPTILSDLQIFDGKHSDDLKDNYRQFIQAHAEVLPRIQACLDEMSKQTEQISSMADAQVVIEEYKTGYTIPDDHQPVRPSLPLLISSHRLIFVSRSIWTSPSVQWPFPLLKNNRFTTS